MRKRIGMQARHRMPPLKFWSMLWAILRLLTEFWSPPLFHPSREPSTSHVLPISTRFGSLEHRGGRPHLMRREMGCWLFRTSNQRPAMSALKRTCSGVACGARPDVGQLQGPPDHPANAPACLARVSRLAENPIALRPLSRLADPAHSAAVFRSRARCRLP
jgi:hypothetical protein